ncbi:restriction modification system DNA specificity domain-containing protein [Burkholderia pseudomallei]|nr:restriction modification system DNA specificity domain-containing protein [Burkholderia pseudomallei]
MSEQKSEKCTLVPPLRFPEFREAGEWALNNLGDLSAVVRGGSPRPIDGFLTTAANGLNWLKIGDVDKEAKYVASTEEKVRPEALNKTRVVNPGDLILSNSMSFGRPYLMKIKSCIHDGWIAITELNKRVSREYLYYLIFSPISQAYFLRNAAGTGVLNLNAEIIRALPVAYPSSREQQKIADCLTSLDELLTAENQKLNTLNTQKKGLMQQLFPRDGETTPRFRFPEFQDADEWEPTTVGQIADFKSGGTPSKENSAFWGGSIPWASAKDMKQLFLDDTEDHITTAAVEDGAKQVPAGVILILTRGMTLLKDIPISVPTQQMSFNQDVKALQPKRNFDGRFIAYLLLGCKQQLLSLVDVAGHGTGRLDTDKLKAFDVMLPQLAEQQRIADCLFSFEEIIAVQSQRIDALKTHKKALMQQLFPRLDEAQR